MTRAKFRHLTRPYPELGGYAYAVYEMFGDRPVLRVISGAHFGSPVAADMAGRRECERVRQVAARHGDEEVAA